MDSAGICLCTTFDMQVNRQDTDSPRLRSSGGSDRSDTTPPAAREWTDRVADMKKVGSVASSSKSGCTKMYKRALLQDAQVDPPPPCRCVSWDELRLHVHQTQTEPQLRLHIPFFPCVSAEIDRLAVIPASSLAVRLDISHRCGVRDYGTSMLV